MEILLLGIFARRLAHTHLKYLSGELEGLGFILKTLIYY